MGKKDASSEAKSKLVKVIFKLQQDEDGYPPVGYESLWGIVLDENSVKIDNVPLYIYGISKGDVILTEKINDEVKPKSIMMRGGHSTLRIYVKDKEIKEKVVSQLQKIGASPKTNKITTLFSVDIPPEVDFSIVDNYLNSIATPGDIEFEDADLQHLEINEERINECTQLKTPLC